MQALRLLRESRRVFDARGRDDEVALRELAETEHLFAKLPLHAQMRVGHEVEGFTMGLKHAGAAERAFRELDDRRELARVWETMGRLELRLCRVQEARQRLEAAFAVQTQIGDLTGLAHTTEVLSDVLAWCGKNAEAVALLRDSVVSNRDKGSPIGLMLNAASRRWRRDSRGCPSTPRACARSPPESRRARARHPPAAGRHRRPLIPRCARPRLPPCGADALKEFEVGIRADG